MYYRRNHPISNGLYTSKSVKDKQINKAISFIKENDSYGQRHELVYVDINLCELRQYCRLCAVLECGNALLATNPGLAKALQPQGDLMILSDDGTRV